MRSKPRAPSLPRPSAQRQPSGSCGTRRHRRGRSAPHEQGAERRAEEVLLLVETPRTISSTRNIAKITSPRGGLNPWGWNAKSWPTGSRPVRDRWAALARLPWLSSRSLPRSSARRRPAQTCGSCHTRPLGPSPVRMIRSHKLPKRPADRQREAAQGATTRCRSVTSTSGPLAAARALSDGSCWEPQQQGSQDQPGVVTDGQFVVAGGDGPVLLEPGDGPLNDVALAIAHRIHSGWPTTP